MGPKGARLAALGRAGPAPNALRIEIITIRHFHSAAAEINLHASTAQSTACATMAEVE